MDHPPSPNQTDLSDASNKKIEDLPGSSKPEDQPDLSHPEEQANPTHPEDPKLTVEEPFQPYIGQDCEYGCKYCTKKFSSKQALGGHYNAHKAERALEKAARELHDIRFSLYNGSSGVTYNPGSYHRSHDFVDRSVFKHFPYNNHQQHGIHVGFNSDPRLPLARVPNAPARPIPGYDNVYPGLIAPGPRVHQFLGQGAYNVRNPGPNIWYPNIGVGNGSSSSRPVDPDLSVFAAPRNMDGIHDQQDEDETGLDLSLKL